MHEIDKPKPQPSLLVSTMIKAIELVVSKYNAKSMMNLLILPEGTLCFAKKSHICMQLLAFYDLTDINPCSVSNQFSEFLTG